MINSLITDIRADAKRLAENITTFVCRYNVPAADLRGDSLGKISDALYKISLRGLKSTYKSIKSDEIRGILSYRDDESFKFNIEQEIKDFAIKYEAELCDFVHDKEVDKSYLGI